MHCEKCSIKGLHNPFVKTGNQAREVKVLTWTEAGGVAVRVIFVGKQSESTDSDKAGTRVIFVGQTRKS